MPRLLNRTCVTVFQHPRERFHALGTVRFLQLGLANSRVVVVHRHLPPPTLQLAESAVLLYPSPDVPLLEELEPPVDELVVVDGTWHHAKTLLRDVPALRRLRRARLAPAEPSRYRLRREPRRECVSTLEATVQALRCLEPTLSGYDALLAAFDAMIDRQIALARRDATTRRQVLGQRPRHLRHLPLALTEQFERVVAIYAERVSTPRGRELVQLVGWRAHDGGVFEARVVFPSDADPTHLRCAGLDPSRPEEALVPAVARFREFCGRAPTLIAWHQRTLDAVSPLLSAGTQVCLKAVYKRAWPQRLGTLEACTRAQALQPHPLPIEGRARERLGCAVALLLHLTNSGKDPSTNVDACDLLDGQSESSRAQIG